MPEGESFQLSLSPYVEVGVPCDLISGVRGEVKLGEEKCELEGVVLEIAVLRYDVESP
jgi:hypothetical protein